MKAICNAVLLVCVAALLALPPVASGAAGKTHEVKIGTIELEGSNDYDLEGRIVSFQASQDEFVRQISFHASLRERVEGMDIERSARTRSEKGAFASSGTSRAVHPPAPFVGSALFRDPAGGHPPGPAR